MTPTIFKPKTGPFAGKGILIAEQVGIERYEALAAEIVLNVCGVQAAWVSDMSDLYDFGTSKEDIIARMLEHYGVDVSEVPSMNLLTICAMVDKSKQH